MILMNGCLAVHVWFAECHNACLHFSASGESSWFLRAASGSSVSGLIYEIIHVLRSITPRIFVSKVISTMLIYTSDLLYDFTS